MPISLRLNEGWTRYGSRKQSRRPVEALKSSIPNSQIMSKARVHRMLDGTKSRRWRANEMNSTILVSKPG